MMVTGTMVTKMTKRGGGGGGRGAEDKEDRHILTSTHLMLCETAYLQCSQKREEIGQKSHPREW